MELNIIRTLKIYKSELRKSPVIIDFPVEDFLEYLEGCTFEDSSDLRGEILSYIQFELDNVGDYDLIDNEYEYELSEIQVSNLNELEVQLSYLISEKRECCTLAPLESFYCNTCGKKLK